MKTGISCRSKISDVAESDESWEHCYTRIPSERQIFWTQIWPEVFWARSWFKTVCKGQSETTLGLYGLNKLKKNVLDRVLFADKKTLISPAWMCRLTSISAFFLQCHKGLFLLLSIHIFSQLKFTKFHLIP